MNNELKCCGCGRETIDRVKQCGCITMAGRAEGAKGTEWMERIPARTHGMVLARIDPPNAAQPVFAIRQDQLDYLANSLTAALAALEGAKSGLIEIEAITPHKATRLCARATLAKLNALEGNEDG